VVEIVAEVSCSHLGKLEHALALMDHAKWAGADAVKFQLWMTPADLVGEGLERTPLKSGAWEGKTLAELYRAAQTPPEWFPTLFDYAKQINLPMFVSPFSLQAVEYLEARDCPRYKIASFELNWLELIVRVAETNKPVVLSTGTCTKDEVATALGCIPRRVPLTTLHCVSAYPTEIGQSNVNRMLRLPFPYGISDHSLGYIVPMTATALGAAMIEKHIMLPSREGLDSAHSLTPDEFRQMVNNVRGVEQALGTGDWENEGEDRTFKRKLVNGEWVRAA